jgi:phospholipase/carboxylesterase
MVKQTNDAVIIESRTTHKASVIWLHGLGANGHDFEPVVPELQLPDELGVRFIFPHAPIRSVTINNGMQMRAWYDVRNVDLRSQEDTTGIVESAGIIKNLIDEEIAGGIPASKILLAGFSQGGAISLHTGLRYPDKLAGLLILSAYLPLPDHLINEASMANKSVAIMMLHGLYDTIIPVAASKQSCEFLQQLGYKIDWRSYPMEHAVCMEEIQTIGNWLKSLLAQDCSV